MKQFIVAYFCMHEGLITQKLITDISKECAIQKMLISQGWHVTPGDCADANLSRLADMVVTAMEVAASGVMGSDDLFVLKVE